MTVRINGQDVDLAAGSPLSIAVAMVTTATGGVAVAVNDEVVPRVAWPRHPIADGDRIEIVTARQGG